MWKAEDTCIDWLNKEAPSSVIYVSFGSLVVLSAKQMECIAKALKNSNSPFIWVVKQPDLPEPDGAGQLPCVPVIAYPKWSDQPTNAKLIVDVFRIGLRLRASKSRWDC
ncbi:hypothetical protein NC651_022527 [Populus alba x Populus x berolinensis]|nr:hypothetical protein NC651_022527 [Populus alba x Populus x berolinensis]